MFKKMMMLAMAMASRGLSNTKIDLPTKKLRTLSCFGHGDIAACPKLNKSFSELFEWLGIH